MIDNLLNERGSGSKVKKCSYFISFFFFAFVLFFRRDEYAMLKNVIIKRLVTRAISRGLINIIILLIALLNSSWKFQACNQLRWNIFRTKLAGYFFCKYGILRFFIATHCLSIESNFINQWILYDYYCCCCCYCSGEVLDQHMDAKWMEHSKNLIYSYFCKA